MLGELNSLHLCTIDDVTVTKLIVATDYCQLSKKINKWKKNSMYINKSTGSPPGFHRTNLVTGTIILHAGHVFTCTCVLRAPWAISSVSWRFLNLFCTKTLYIFIILLYNVNSSVDKKGGDGYLFQALFLLYKLYQKNCIIELTHINRKGNHSTISFYNPSSYQSIR